MGTYIDSYKYQIVDDVARIAPIKYHMLWNVVFLMDFFGSRS